MTFESIASPIKVKEIKLKNGLTVWLNEDRSQSKVVGALVVKIGAKDSPNTGIAHYFEHIMFKGTDRIGTVDYDAEKVILDKIESKYAELKTKISDAERLEVQKEINQLSIEAAKYAIPNDFSNLISKYGGTRLNAGTSYDYTVYHNVFTPQYLEHWCELNSERMISPVFRLFQSELETVYEEKNMYDDRIQSGVMKAIIERIAAPHPYQYPITGSTENLKNPDLTEMRAFFEKYYIAGNMGLILTGDFDADTAIPIIERTFGRIRAGEVERPVAAPPKPFVGAERFTVKFPIPFIKGAMMAWHTVPTYHEDKEAIDVMVALLSNEGKTGLLDRLTVDGKVMMAQAAHVSLLDFGALLVFAVPNPPLQLTSSAQKKLKNAVSAIRNGDFSEDFFQRVKRELLKNTLLSLEDPIERAQIMYNAFASGLSWDGYEQRLKQMEMLTKDDIVRVANIYLTHNYLDIRKKTGRYPKDKIAKPPFAPILPPNRGAESPFAQQLAKLAVPDSDVHILDFDRDVERIYLGDNKLATLYVTENKVNDIFSLDIVYQCNQYNDPRLQYLDEYMTLLGSNSKNAHEVNEAFQNLGASLTWSVARREGVRISLTGYDKYFEETIRLLHDFIFDPKAEQRKIKKLADNKKLYDKSVKKSSDELSTRLFEYVRYGDASDFRRMLTLSEVKKLKGEDLLQLLRQVLKTEVDIHYTGQLKAGEISDLLYSALKIGEVNRAGDTLSFLEPLKQQETKIFVVNEPKVNQAVIRAYVGIDDLTSKEMDSAELYTTYLGRGMNSLLFQEIREYRSMAYGVGGYFDSLDPIFEKEKGDLILYMSTQADKTADAIFLLDSLVRLSPEVPERYENARKSLINIAYTMYPDIRRKGRRISNLRRRGFKNDIAVDYLNIAANVSQEEVKRFHQHKIQEAPIIYTVVGNTKYIDIKRLRQLGEVIFLKDKDFLRF
ncbi:pitrilysin family protein [Porphyromonas sp.]|uniref:M16 family metallopeptidase n=1 Tax=Porphyromonas sp. TaxID=1924944 RepID=UPI0026DB0A32|nr:insulinase family protein [Porphyromonas sp.]MDO4695156.1 insulinase family protein [Porphyromonas sp.]MDO4770902.1 insulinase family protein [Porphyromonas sp.]